MLKTKSRLFSLPIIGAYVSRMVGNIEKHGMQGAILKEIERSKTNWEIHGLDQETKKILQTKGAVIVANHPFEIETLALIAALPKRENINLIATSFLQNIYPALDKHLIPVYITHHYKDVRSTRFRKLSGLILEKYYQYHHLTESEEHQKNIESIALAAKKVKNGEVVIILPNPHRQKNYQDKWHPGIGWLLKNIGAKDNLYYVQAYVSGSSNWDYLRLFPGLGRFLPKIKVHFARPQKIADLDSSDPKRLTAKLEKEYLDWTTSYSIASK